MTQYSTANEQERKKMIEQTKQLYDSILLTPEEEKEAILEGKKKKFFDEKAKQRENPDHHS